MNMKREELRQWFAEWLDDYYDELCSEDELTPEVAESVLAALRPVSREQIEKVWRAHWNESTHLGGFVYCSRCGYNALDANNYTFCPKCGSPFTDEAVEMVMERLEALQCGN